MRPAAGVVALTAEILDAGDVRHVRDEQRPDGTNEKLRSRRFASMRIDGPPLTIFVVARIGDPGFELDVPAQVVAVGKVFEIGQHGRLGGLRLRPVPVVNETLVEGICVEGAARRIDARARIAVVPPGTTDPPCTVERAHVQAELIAQMMM